MLALDERVVGAVWAVIEPLIPPVVDNHPLGCHRPRIADFTCFRGLVARLVTGCSWDVAGRLVGVGETTLRRRRTEWVRAGIFAALADAVLGAYDRVVGLHPEEVSIDGSTHKAPCGGPGTGPNPRDGFKSGWKLSLVVDQAGVPLAWTTGPANAHDTRLLEESFDALDARGLELEVGTVHLDRGYDFGAVRRAIAEAGIDAVVPRRRGQKTRRVDKRIPKAPRGQRWTVERANSWFTNYGQLRRSTDRRIVHREATIDLAVALMLTVKILKWHRRYGPVIAG